MKNFKLMTSLLVFMSLVLASCEREEPVTVEFKSPSYSVTVGEEMDMSGELVVANSDVKPEWTVSDKAVATVDADGKLLALAAGEATVTAIVEGKSATCDITVSEMVANSITVTAPEVMYAGEEFGTVRVTVEPADYDKDNLVWTFTPSSDEVEIEYEKASASEYRLRFKNFVVGGKVTVKVADSRSDVFGTAETAVAEKVVPAAKISLEMPAELTEGEDIWGTIKAVVTPEDYDAENLVWDFKASSADLKFGTVKVSDTEYKLRFENYVPDGNVTVVVSDKLSEVFNQGRIKVLERPVEGVISLSVSPKELSLNVGDEPVTLQLSYEPADYDKSLLEWTSSDEEVAAVSGGVVTVVGEGEADIKVKDTVSGKEAECRVTVTTPVKDVVVKRIDISETYLELRVGEESVQLTVTCFDEAGNVVENYSDIEWSAEKMTGDNGKEIVVVEVSQQGVVTPKNPGSTQVIVKDKNNAHIKALCNVSVKAAEVKVEEIRLQPSSKVIEQGSEFELTTVVLPENAENKTLTFTSDNEKVATVSDAGLVKGIEPGEAVITVTSANGVKAECKVTVAEESWVYLSEMELTMVEGEERTITATVTPENAPDKTVTWSSSAPEVATVDGGRITAVKEGVAIITASAANGKKAECKVTVESKAIEFDITLTPSDANVTTRGLMQDKSVRLVATYIRKIDGNSHTPAHTEWRSSDSSIATVDSEGNVTAVIEHIEESGFANGRKVVITHIADEKQKEMEITVVKAMPEEIVLIAVPQVNGEDFKMMHGDYFDFKAKVLPEKASQEVNFQSSASGVAFLEGGRFYANSPGKVNFTAYAGDDTNVRYHFSVDVLPVPGTQVQLSNTDIEIMEGAEAALMAGVVPENASYKTITWQSSDEGIATVDQNGIVRGISEGKAVITALQEENAISATCEVTVKAVAQQYSIGDYLYSSGKASSKPDEDEATYGKVIGVIFSLNNPTLMGDTALAEDFPDCTHGFAVGINEVSASWSSMSNEKSWLQNNGHDAVMNENIPNGYYNTKALGELRGIRKNEDGFGENYMAMFDAETGVAARYNEEVAVPEKASTWYVASFMDMKLLYENKDVVNESLKGASGNEITGSRYWISTLFNAGWTTAHYAFDFNTGGRTSTQPTASNSYPVRLILAF